MNTVVIVLQTLVPTMDTTVWTLRPSSGPRSAQVFCSQLEALVILVFLAKLPPRSVPSLFTTMGVLIVFVSIYHGTVFNKLSRRLVPASYPCSFTAGNDPIALVSNSSE